MSKTFHLWRPSWSRSFKKKNTCWVKHVCVWKSQPWWQVSVKVIFCVLLHVYGARLLGLYSHDQHNSVSDRCINWIPYGYKCNQYPLFFYNLYTNTASFMYMYLLIKISNCIIYWQNKHQNFRQAIYNTCI